MLPVKQFIALLFFSVLYLNVFSQHSGLEKINKDDLQRHLNFLASDSLQGRAFGTPVPGIDIAADYIKTNIKNLGLKDGAEDFYQTFTIYSMHPDRENSFLKLTDKKDTEIYKSDSIIGFTSGSGIDITGAEIVFAGFGYRNEKSGYNDYEGISIKGKLVMFSAGTPDRYKKREKPRWDNGLERAKIQLALDSGAIGVLVVNSPLDKGNSLYNRIARWKNRGTNSLKSTVGSEDNFNFVYTTSSQADKILGTPGKLNSLLEKISKKNQPKTFEITGKKVTLMFKNIREEIHAKNVIGIIGGSDEKLQNECVVFMAHYDHVGMNENGEIFNGADDNGSGVVTLLELAEAFQSLEKKPKRSIVLLWVTAEEIGLLGSRYYAENPTFDMEQTVTCINIDMDGRVYETRDSVWKDSPKIVKDYDGLYTLTNSFWPELKEINTSVCKNLGIIPDYSLPSRFLRSSDHFSFHDKGLPIINYATGYHADYHEVTDEISKINFDKIKRVTELCFLLGLEIANKEKIEIVNP